LGERFRHDLTLAGIPYKDELGRVAAFHSPRKTFGTNLARAGVPRRTAMELMRHGDSRLTGFLYTDTNLLGTPEAIADPPLLLNQPSQIASQILGAEGHLLSSPVTTDDAAEADETPETIGQSRVLARGDAGRRKGANGARCRVRTCDPFGVNEVLYH